MGKITKETRQLLYQNKQGDITFNWWIYKDKEISMCVQ